MAVVSNRKSHRLAGLALAISVFAIPGVALANPENGGRGTREVRSEEDAREPRSEGGGGQGRQEQTRQQSWSQPAQSEAPMQAPVQQARQTGWSGGNDGGNANGGGRDRGNWNGGDFVEGESRRNCGIDTAFARCAGSSPV